MSHSETVFFLYWLCCARDHVPGVEMELNRERKILVLLLGLNLLWVVRNIERFRHVTLPSFEKLRYSSLCNFFNMVFL